MRAWQEFQAMTDPLSVWLEQFTIDDPEAVVAKQVLRAAYGADCERKGRPAPTDNAFGRVMAKARPDVTTAQRHVNGRKQWCFIGIGLRGDTSQQSQQSQDSHTLLYRGETETKEEEESNSQEYIKSGKPVIAVIPVTEQLEPKASQSAPGSEEKALNRGETEVFTI